MRSTKSPELGSEGRVLEGIVTTLNKDDTVNISPMGPIVDEQIQQLVLRPFCTSTTYQNLKRTGQGVFHVTDDVELFAQSAVGAPTFQPQMSPASTIEGMVLVDACRWYAFRVDSLNDRDERAQIEAHTEDSGRNRDFFGFNRAMHAVIEAAILATRVHLVPYEDLLVEFERLAPPVEKTASEKELRAYRFLRAYVERCSSCTEQVTPKLEISK